MAKQKPDLRMFGLVKIGEKGQIVIPANARQELDMHAGDEIIVFGSSSKGVLGVIREEDFRSMLGQMRKRLEQGIAVGSHFINIEEELDNLKSNSK